MNELEEKYKTHISKLTSKERFDLFVREQVEGSLCFLITKDGLRVLDVEKLFILNTNTLYYENI